MLPSLAVLASAFFWGTMWMPLRHLETLGLSGAWGSFLIYSLPLFALLPWAVLRRRRLQRAGALLWVVGAGTGLCNILFAIALLHGEITKIVLLFYLNPVWSMLLERLFWKTPMRRWRLMALGLSFCGLIVLLGFGGGLPLPHTAAEWMGLIAGICWSVGVVATRLAHDVGVTDKVFAQFLFAGMAGAIAAIWPVTGQAMPEAATIRDAIPWLVATSVFWVLPSIALSLWGASRISPTRTGMLLMFEVIVASLTAALWAGEIIDWHEIVGGAMIVAAALLDLWRGSAVPARHGSCAITDQGVG